MSGLTAARAASRSSPAQSVPVDSSIDETLLTEPQQGYGPVYTFILGAKKSVDMTMYELSDPVAEAALAADARRGVDVRVILDADYSGEQSNAAAYRYLARHDVHVVWAYPDETIHQKTITVDGTTSLIMTGNLSARYYASTRDFGVFDSDPPDVRAIERTFASDFARKRPAPAPAGADLLWSPGAQGELVHLIDSARHTLAVESEEMDSSSIESALARAAARGVRVDVTMTYDPSWTMVLDKLTAAGVKVTLFHGENPIYIHAKVVSVDAGQADQCAFIGSENFSNASLRHNRELGLVTTDPAVLAPLNATLASDFSGSPAR